MIQYKNYWTVIEEKDAELQQLFYFELHFEPKNFTNRLIFSLYLSRLTLNNRLMAYNWQQKDWTDFKFNLNEIEDLLLQYNRNLGRIEGTANVLSSEEQIESLIEFMILEAIKTNEIEGESLNRKDVASSIRKNLGLLKHAAAVKDPRANGIAELMILVRNSFMEPLTDEMLFLWHKKLMGHNAQINSGMWRHHNEPMQIVSGALGKEKVHF